MSRIGELLAQADTGGGGSGPLAGAAFLVSTLTGMVVAVTALVKVLVDKRRKAVESEAPPAGGIADEHVDEAQARIVREALEALGDAQDEAAHERERREAAEAEADGWRNRYIELLEKGHAP